MARIFGELTLSSLNLTHPIQSGRLNEATVLGFFFQCKAPTDAYFRRCFAIQCPNAPLLSVSSNDEKFEGLANGRAEWMVGNFVGVYTKVHNS